VDRHAEAETHAKAGRERHAGVIAASQNRPDPSSRHHKNLLAAINPPVATPSHTLKLTLDLPMISYERVSFRRQVVALSSDCT
jgi:hypothetical protein